jgi:hypothetical protein
MKNHVYLRGIALILMLVMTLSVFVACDNSNDTPAETTKPVETTKAPETTEHTHDYGEPTLTKAPTCTEFGEKTATCSCGKTAVTSVPALGHTFGTAVETKAPTCTEKGQKTATCSTCGGTEVTDIDALGHTFGTAVETEAPTCTEKGQKTATCSTCGGTEVIDIDMLPHTFTNNVCTVCGSKAFTNAANNYGLTGALELTSKFDGDKSGANDTFYFSSTLVEKFTGENAITIASGDYDTTASKDPSKNTSDYEGLPHYYIKEKTDQSLVYKVTVTEGGIYDLAIHLRFKDNKERGNKFTVNPGTDSEYTFETSFAPTTDQVNATKSTDGKDSVYMYGMQIYLNEGENIIKIEDAGCAKCQHYRHFYLVKAA